MPSLEDRCGIGNSALLHRAQSNSQKFLPQREHRLATCGVWVPLGFAWEGLRLEQSEGAGPVRGMQRPRRASAEDNVNTMPAATARVSPQGTRVHAHVSEGSVKSLRAAVSSRLTVPGARALSNVCRQESRSERGGGRVGVRVLTLPGPWPEALHVWFQPSSRPGLPGAQPPEGNACHISSCLVLSALIFSIWGH